MVVMASAASQSQSNQHARNASSTSSSSASIELTEDESKLFKTLLEVCRARELKTTLRAAGGWVRDKLLGKSSKDIDVALDDMLGREFAQHINEHLQASGKDSHRFAVIASNPDQSKHLETATIRVEGIDIDLVNLRAEDYADNSRIPTMKFGTPTEDAMRRDLTINALFYNLQTGLVEDFTGNGLSDLQAGYVRTPLAPRDTLLDDPLRALRAVRFAARYGFTIDPPLLESMADADVQKALETKVSRERWGVEVDGMLKGGAPVFTRAVAAMVDSTLFPVVFHAPCIPAESGGVYAACAQAHLKLATTIMQEEWASGFAGSIDRMRIVMLASSLAPLRHCIVSEHLDGSRKKARPQPASRFVVATTLKLRSKDADAVALVQGSAMRLRSHFDASTVFRAASDDEDARSCVPEEVRESLGWIVKDLRDDWRGCVLVASTFASLVGKQQEEEDAVDFSEPRDADVASEEARLVIRAIERLGLDSCWEWRPMLDGPKMMEVLGMEKPGKELGLAMRRAAGWQYRFPDGTEEELVKWIKAGQGQQQQQQQ